MPGGDKSKTSPRRVDVALRRAKALRMRAAGASYAQILAAGLGYKSASAAVQDIQRALAATVGEPAADVRTLEVLRCDEALQRLVEREAKVLRVRDRTHYVVSQGKVVYLDGEPLVDDAPVLAANAQLIAIEAARRAIQERRSKYLGLDSPVRVEAEITESTQQDLELIDLINSAKARVAADEARRGAAP